ncbi:hypothetical protein [Duganella vulcania]|uniref:Uncharacterized protein n=1 Tax=Duganella vulcania TaxID=2692166 RepID=A0A845GDP5_9BURK|nr:hypothetical protein [Duganella vulcania]MYM92743.1 hypothetical protein [Duganella vulcania]
MHKRYYYLAQILLATALGVFGVAAMRGDLDPKAQSDKATAIGAVQAAIEARMQLLDSLDK